MESGRFEGSLGSHMRNRKERVLLREPERCMECKDVFISLYPIKCCKDHDCIDRV